MNLTSFDSVNFDLTFEDRCRVQNLVTILKDETTIDKPIPSEDLEPRIGLTGKSSGVKLRALVSYMRAHLHLPIGSGDKGYFWARNRQELESTKQHLAQRTSKMHAVIAGLEQAFPPEEQGRLL